MRSRSRCLYLCVALCVAIGFAPTLAAKGVGPMEAAPCRSLAPAESSWIQSALDAWSTVERDVVGLGERPLPWMVLFDEQCTWHLNADPTAMPRLKEVASPLEFAGRTVPLRVEAHRDSVLLPTGKTIPAQPTAFSSLYGDSDKPFFVLALPTVWQAAHPEVDERRIGGFMLSVLAHEMTHTLNLATISARMDELKKRHDLPESIQDTVVEEHFSNEPGFVAAREKERSQLFEAILAKSDAQSRHLTCQALGTKKARANRFLSGGNAGYQEVEELLVATEGMSCLSAFALARRLDSVPFNPDHPEAGDATQALETLRDHPDEWVQDVGLVEFLLLERLGSPNWSKLALDPTPAGMQLSIAARCG